MGLKEELEEEQKKRKEIETRQVVPPEPTPQQKAANVEAEIKLFKIQQDLDSLKLGYDNFKLRESTIIDIEKALADREERLKKNIGTFELEQKERVAKANAKADEYNEAFMLLQTERTEAKRIMEDAIRKKSEADNIIKSQTEAERVYQEKQGAYIDNMDESLKLFAEIIGVLKQQEDGASLTLAVELGKDYYLMQWLQYKNCNLSTLADIIAVVCERITETCGHLQDSKKDYSSLLNYLLQSTDWFEKALMIQWQPKPDNVSIS